MLARFNGNVVPFADDATSTNRTVFGGITQSDAIDDNLNADFKKGWEIVGLNDNPTREDFNAMGYTLSALTAYLYEMGISEWNASQKYRANSRVTGSDGKIYKSLTGTTGIPNVGNNPTTDTVNWQVEHVTDYSSLTNKTTPIDADLIAISDSTSSFSLKKLSWVNLKATLKTYFDTLYLTLTGNQTVGGIKTFSSSPVVPTPSVQDNSTKVATTAYVDGKMVLGTAIATTSGTAIDFTGIPSWVKRIKIMFNGISTNGSSIVQLQLGSGTIKTTGYLGSFSGASASAIASATLTTGLGLTYGSGAATVSHGIAEINLLGSNLYLMTSMIGKSDVAGTNFSGASVALTGALDRIRLTTASGTDQFDAGSINIMYEG